MHAYRRNSVHLCCVAVPTSASAAAKYVCKLFVTEPVCSLRDGVMCHVGTLSSPHVYVCVLMCVFVWSTGAEGSILRLASQLYWWGGGDQRVNLASYIDGGRGIRGLILPAILMGGGGSEG